MIFAWSQTSQPQGGGKLTPLLTTKLLTLCAKIVRAPHISEDKRLSRGIHHAKIRTTPQEEDTMANQEQLDLLKQGGAVWNTWRKQHPSLRPDLSGADLSGANLSQTRLRDAYLMRANLRGANLRGADLKYALQSHLFREMLS
jgi:hypothetical protein